jgi:hypothetical protein
MKLDGNPFPQNMIGFSVNMVTAEKKGTVEQVHKETPHILKSRIEVGESSKSKPRVTSRILLNKWQRQQEKERYQK